MRRRLLVPCPNCDGGESKYYKTEEICPHCRGNKEVDLLYHHSVLGITDERNANVKSFINDSRFMEYLVARNSKV